MASSKRNIGLRIAFDGSGYNGWQLQPDANTVETVVRAAIDQIENRKVPIVSASRTDSGVHANGQYVNFISHATIPTEKYAAALNRHLHPSITILSSREHAPSFHARYSAIRRTYLYKIVVSAYRSPSQSAYHILCPRMPNITQCNRALSALCGTHDFYSFAKVDDHERSTMRTVYRATMYPHGGAVWIQISANSFLRTMVRSIVGTLLDEERCSQAHMQKMLYTHNRRLCGSTAPACGLYLDWIDYE